MLASGYPAALTLPAGDPHLAVMPEIQPASRKSLVIKLGVLVLLALGAGVLLLLGKDLKAWMFSGLDFVRSLGPGAFFTAMALTPAVGAPVMVFALTAGPVFGDRLGLGVVILLALAAVTVNILLTYALARWTFRPPPATCRETSEPR